MTKTYLKYKTRITILAGFVLFSWAGLCARLFQVQVLNGKEYKVKVVEQSQKKQIIPANRGNIFDRNNKPLTRNIIHYTLSVNPKKVIDKIVPELRIVFSLVAHAALFNLKMLIFNSAKRPHSS